VVVVVEVVEEAVFVDVALEKAVDQAGLLASNLVRTARLLLKPCSDVATKPVSLVQFALAAAALAVAAG
jgi:hypothetical protein